MPITAKGFEARRFPEILASINQSLVDNLSIQLNTSPDEVLTIINSIISSTVADQEETIQAVYKNLDLDTAEGVHLDKVVAKIGLKRLSEGYTTGPVFLKTSLDGAVVNTSTLFRDTSANTYRATASTTINSQSCSSLTFSPNIDQGTFSVTINGVLFETVIASPSSLEDIAAELQSLILAEAPTEYTVARSAESVTVVAVNKFAPLNTSRNANISFLEVEGAVSVIATEVGPINPNIGTVTTILTNAANFTSVTNYDTFTVGRNKETDSELRIRHRNSTQLSGSSTSASIYAALANLEGVSLVRIFSNTGSTPDETGRPPNTFECVVEGGDAQTIGNTIWNKKPEAVGTYGEQTTLVVDYANKPQAVRWSRPILRYINVRVTYTTYNEEPLPDNLSEAIKAAIVTYGDNLGLDTDVIPQRFYGVIYGATTGLGGITIEIGTSLSPSSATPDEIAYSTNTLPIGQREKADFDNVRIQVIAG